MRKALLLACSLAVILQEDPPVGVSGAPSENNIMQWNAVIFGPEGTPFEDGTFKLVIEFSEEYPNKPPTVRFLSKMFHPNVYADGSICLDILQNRWSPTYDVSSILTSIQSLLDEPNPNSPANSQAAQLYQENKREYEKRVSAIVEQSWNDSGSQQSSILFGADQDCQPALCLWDDVQPGLWLLLPEFILIPNFQLLKKALLSLFLILRKPAGNRQP
ncbi:hypothetical protein IHE44_0003782 [Lamprotornis superbus]|uniref:E2 ubiquitin-conjugating enzyme n=1 Tax=Lamprotornis superbus TaxID=245042 RepID=A0A835TUB6_9PASS|nr:hypothetical protein IHE44_0003782 [Lamprotornis superbus]